MAMNSPFRMTFSKNVRFSRSEIPGSKLACSSPRLIAAGHVFHLSLAPRHPPCALYNLLLLALDHRFFSTAPGINCQITLKKTFCWMFFHRILLSISFAPFGASRLSEVVILANLFIKVNYFFNYFFNFLNDSKTRDFI